MSNNMKGGFKVFGIELSKQKRKEEKERKERERKEKEEREKKEKERIKKKADNAAAYAKRIRDYIDNAEPLEIVNINFESDYNALNIVYQNKLIKTTYYNDNTIFYLKTWENRDKKQLEDYIDEQINQVFLKPEEFKLLDDNYKTQIKKYGNYLYVKQPQTNTTDNEPTED